jgi:hypothetical protein
VASHDPSTRVLAAQAAALTRWGKLGSTEDRSHATQPARDAKRERYEHEADPDGRLTPAERARAADQLQRAHMIRMSLRAKAARARAKKNLEVAAEVEAELSAMGGDAA